VLPRNRASSGVTLRSVVLSDSEVRAIVGHLTGAPQLCVTITYGSGLRLLECLRLRVKDIDFDRRTRVAAELGR